MTHPLVIGWAISKYGLPEGTDIKIEWEEAQHVGCPTCGYGEIYPGMVITARPPGLTWYEVDKIENCNMADLMDEVLNWATE